MAVDFISLSATEKAEFLQRLGQPGFRLQQIEKWVYERATILWQHMTDLPLTMRDVLQNSELPVVAAEVVSRLDSAWASKFLIKLSDDQAVETVAMRYDHGISLCVSSQVGCKMACSFCASAVGGLSRNLQAGEIMAQLLLVNNQLMILGHRVSHIVFMGMGEPLDNYDNVLHFVREAAAMTGISPRRMTVSTCGLVPAIYRLAKEELPLTLSVSLHAPDDELRTKLMPVNRVYPLKELLPAMRHYAEVTGRRVSVEYTMIEGVNDSRDCAQELASLLGKGFHINLISVNPVEGANMKKPAPTRMNEFLQILRRRGQNVTLRRELGLEIHGSCGQLRRREIGEQS